MKRLIITSAVVCILSVGLTNIVHADIVTLSTTMGERLGETEGDYVDFQDGDMVEYNLETWEATVIFYEDDHFPNKDTDIDAVHILDNGHIILSTKTDATLAGLSFRDGDLVDYDPVADIATRFFSEDLFTDDEDIDAVYVIDYNHIILSTQYSATLADYEFEPADLVFYNRELNEAYSIIEHTEFNSRYPNIDAVSFLDEDHIILSTDGYVELGINGLGFDKEDMVKYNLKTKWADLFFDGSERFLTYHTDTDIDAVHIPEPATMVLLGLGALGLLGRGKK